MALTKDGLRALVALHEKDKVLDDVQQEIAAVPPKIEAARADLEGEKRHIEAAKAKIVELEKAKKAKELDVAGKIEAARKHSAQLNELKSNDAYKSMQAEIDKEKAAADVLETEILQIMEDIDKAKAEEKAAAAEFKKTEEFAKKDIEKLEAELSHAKGEHARLKAERDASAAPVPPQALKVYEHVRSRGKNDAIVPVVDGHCSGCQINLAPSLMAEVTKLKDLAVCESCQRILYKPELLAPTAA